MHRGQPATTVLLALLALLEALSLGQSYIGSEHILLGLVRENEGVPPRILREFDTGAEKIRNEVIRMLSAPGARQRGVTGSQEETDDAPGREIPSRGELSDEELEALIHELAEKERKVSYEGRVLHGQIDVLRAELVNRRGRGQRPTP